MTATLTETILTVDGIRSPMLQAGPPQATEAVVFVPQGCTKRDRTTPPGQRTGPDQRGRHPARRVDGCGSTSNP